MLLAFFGDLSIDVWIKGHGKSRGLLDTLDIKTSCFRSQMLRYLKTNDIEKIVDKNGKPCFKLSPLGYEKINRMYPLFELSQKKWDGKWRIVIFDIREKDRKDRDFLRFKLVSLGFGKLQESVYVTPLDVLVDLKEFLKSEKLYGRVLVFEAINIFGDNYKAVAEYVWNLDGLSNEYQKLLDEANWIEKNGGTKKEMDRLREDYFGLLLRDPLLPSEFLPDNWMGEKARNKILSL